MRDGVEIKKELLEKAQELASKAENAVSFADIADLRKKWRRASSEEESLLEKELSDKFEEALMKIKEISGDINVSVEERKTALINEVKALKDNKNFKNANAKMNEIMDSWKGAGRAIKEKDDELWEQFKAAKDEFYDAKRKYVDELKTSLEENKNKKEEIISKAIEANTKTNFKEIGSIMDSLMEEWKKVGRASKEFEDDLWKRFNEQRQNFYKNRKAYYASMKETYEKRAEEKREIIKNAKLCLARSEFSDEEVESMKSFRESWKKIGSAGKDNEDTLWEEFNGILNKYYENLRYYKK